MKSGRDVQAVAVLTHDAQVRFLDTSHVCVLEGGQNILLYELRQEVGDFLLKESSLFHDD